MGNQKAGMGAEVGVNKIPEGDDSSESPPRWAYVLVYLMVVFSLLGLWRAVELALLFT